MAVPADSTSNSLPAPQPLKLDLHTRSDRYLDLHTATCMERVQVAVPTSGEHALEVWEAIGAKALWRARGEWCEPPTYKLYHGLSIEL